MRNPLSTGKAIVCIALTTLFTIGKTQAQPPYAATVPDNYLAPVTPPLSNVNCDMVECPNFGGQTLKAIAWDNGFYVIFGTNPPVPISYPPNTYFPDIVIGDDMSDLGNKYIIATTYGDNAGGNFYMDTYTYDVATNTLTLASANGPFSGVKMPRIDLFADNVNQFNGLPTLHKFVVVWPATTGIRLMTGDISSVPSASFYTVTANGEYPDVAAVTDLVNNKEVAEVAYYNNNTGFAEVQEVDVNGIFATGAPVSFIATQDPRIEAMGVYANSTDAKWLIVGSGSGGVYGMTDITSASNYTFPLGVSSAAWPVVAAGIGTTAGNPGNIANNQYPVGWHEPHVDFFAQSVDVATGVLTSPTDYYHIPFTAVTGTPGTSANPLALSSCSNSGSGILSAWCDGSDIYYKESSNIGSPQTFGFKTNGINKINVQHNFSVYPNPATDKVTVQLTHAATNISLSIKDISGREVFTKTYNHPGGQFQEQVDTTPFAQGTYLVSINAGSEQYTQKLTVKK